MTDRRRRRAASSDSAPREDNPFAPPPEGRPDQPWQPRHRTDDDSHGAQGTGNGNGSSSPGGSSPDGEDGSGSSGKKPSSWGSQWSSRQPGRQSGGFGKPRGNGDGDGPGGSGGGQGRGLRWDPTDPAQRRARYALHCGIWGLFFALFSLAPVGLLLGALSLYWGITSLRAKNRVDAKSGGAKDGSGSGDGQARAGAGPTATAADISGSTGSASPSGEARGESGSGSADRPAVTPAQAAKAQATAAIGGVVTGALALAVVAATFTFQTVYSDYFTCERDALTQSSREDCKQLLPEQFRPFFEDRTPT